MSIKNLYPTIKPSLLLDFAKTKRLDPRITFARASTATCYDGKTVAKAEENLLTYSQEFDNAIWIKLHCSVTANTDVAPNGTTTAETVTSSSTSFPFLYKNAFPIVSGNAYTLSIYAKAGTVGYLILDVGKPADSYVWFNLSTGAVGTQSGATGTSVSVGNGWYRFSATATATASTTANMAVCLSDVDGAQTIASGKTALIWGAQVEQRSSVTAYTPTTTQPITNYIPVLQTVSANTARFDHDPVTSESKGLLIEEQRTSLLPYSEDFSYWGATNSTVQSNIIVAPDGTMTGDKLVPNTAQDYTFVGKTYMISATTYTFSVYAKAGEYSRMSFWEGNVTAYFATFDLLTGTVVRVNGPTTAKIENAGNGWYRCSMTASYNAINAWWIIKPLDGSTTSPFDATRLGDGYSGVYIWGAQLEAGAFPTSYIKTEASQVTRAADAASITGTNFSSWYNQDEGTIFVNGIKSQTVSGNPAFCAIGDGGFNNRISLGFNSNGTLAALVSNLSNIEYYQSTTARQDDGLIKLMAFGYKFNDTNWYLDGVDIGSNDSITTIPSAVHSLFIGRLTGSGGYLNGTIKKIAYYPERLTNSQLENLTK
jgi:hypothetical protein